MRSCAGSRLTRLWFALVLGFLLFPPCRARLGFTDAASDFSQPLKRSIHAPLKVLPANPRYFSDGSNRAVYLTGSHTWLNFRPLLFSPS
jgi:hypothetical protein